MCCSTYIHPLMHLKLPHIPTFHLKSSYALPIPANLSPPLFTNLIGTFSPLI